MLYHCWLGHLTCKVVPEITYKGSSETLRRYSLTLQLMYRAVALVGNVVYRAVALVGNVVNLDKSTKVNKWLSESD